MLAHNSFTSYSDNNFDNNGDDDNDDIDDFKMVHVKKCANRGNYQTFISRKTSNVPRAGLKKTFLNNGANKSSNLPIYQG